MSKPSSLPRSDAPHVRSSRLPESVRLARLAEAKAFADRNDQGRLREFMGKSDTFPTNEEIERLESAD